MVSPRNGEPRPGAASAFVLGVGVLAVLCCAGLPLVASVVGALTVAGVVGVGAGVVIAAGAVSAGVLLLRAHRRRTSPTAAATRPAPPEATGGL
jgi:hypothetical protein